MSDFDAVIIGAGPNGLSAGIRLAQAGWKVLVMEASSTVGGGTRTKELTLPGFLHDVCSAVHPTGAASPFFHSLNLEDYGLEWIHPEIPLAHPLEGGRAAVLWQCLDKTAQGLGRDEAAYRLLFEEIANRASELYPDVFTPIKFPASPLLMARFGTAAMMPASLLARALFKSEEARALLAGNAAHSVLPLESWFSAAIAIMLQMSAHAVGWPVARGGSQSIAHALESKLRALGGEVTTNSRAMCFEKLPPARCYLFDTSPATVLKVADHQLPSGYKRRLRAFQHGPGVFKIDYALSGPVPWTNKECQKAGTVHVGGTLDEICASEADACNGLHSDRPFVLAAQPSVCDPTRAPAGKAVLWAYCHVPQGSTRDMEPFITAQIERFAPGFRDLILAKSTMNCSQMEAYNENYVGGDIVGGMASWSQILTRPVTSLCPYATPNPKIYLCSASTPPAGGVHGMCGWNAANAVLARMDK
ncbi:MAG: NAD(P)/FAD-dependent oxidoreductase [Verrucomicrobiaceae bacterium]|nr:NAD(P)/FAD-dependent oxidoreductase [Verrucomicrobiaceae bacterium]